MQVAPKTRAFFDRLKKEAAENPGQPSIEQVPLDVLRKATIELFREYAGSFPDGVSAKSFQDYAFDLPCDASIHVKVYTPESFDPFSGSSVIFFQGNGFLFDVLDAHLPGFARMAMLANCQVIGVDTPLAPEHSAQEINNISYETVRYVYQNADRLGVNSENIILGGYSSGGNLVANIINRLQQSKEIQIKHQLLMSPSLDLSLQTHANNPFLKYQNLDESVSTAALEYVVKTYYQDNDPRDPLISPMFQKDLSGLPPTTIVLAEFDGARGDGEVYAKKLKEAGTSVEVLICEGQTHNYFIARGVMGDEPDPAIVMAKAILKVNDSAHEGDL